MFIRNPMTYRHMTSINKLNQAIRNTKQTYYHNLFTKSNINKTWSYINAILKGGKTKHIPSQILMNDKLINNSKNLCECFNSCFTNLGINISKGIPCSRDPLLFFLYSHSLFFTLTNQFEFEKIINSCKITMIYIKKL